MFFSKEDGTAESPHNLLTAKISYNIFVLKEKGAHTLICILQKNNLTKHILTQKEMHHVASQMQGS